MFYIIPKPIIRFILPIFFIRWGINFSFLYANVLSINLEQTNPETKKFVRMRKAQFAGW